MDVLQTVVVSLWPSSDQSKLRNKNTDDCQMPQSKIYKQNYTADTFEEKN